MSAEPTLRSDSPVHFGRIESLLQLFALSSLAIAQPMLDVLGQFGEFLVAHQLEPVEIVTLTLVLVAAAPLALWLIVLSAGRISTGLASRLHLLFAGVLAGLWALRALALFDGLGSILSFAGALAGGALFSWLLHRSSSVRKVVSWAAVGVVVFSIHFLFFSPVARLLSGFEAEPASQRVAAGDQGPPLVLIVFDELPMGSLLTPEGVIDAARFPHFAALARDGVVYTRATTVTSGTAYAIPAILTGRYPAERKFPIHLDYRENLFTLLADRYRVHAHETLTQLCPQDLCAQERPPAAERVRALASDLRIVFLHLVLPSEAASRLPSITGRWRDFGAHWRPDGRGGVVGVERSERLDIPGLVQRYVEAIQSERAVLHYLHLELPHVPWRYLPSGMEYGPVEQAIGVDEEAAWRDDEWLLTLALQRHLAQTAYADRVLGQIVAALRDRGIYDGALLVVTADHGLAFRIGEPARRLTEANIAEVASVPLILRGPGFAPGRRENKPVEVVDILPTLAEAAGVEVPWQIDGMSLLDPRYEGRESKTLSVPEEGLRASVAAHAVAESNLAAARRIATSFPQPGVEGLFGIGRNLKLVDRPAAEVPQRAGGDIEVAINQSWFYDAVDPGSGFVPARVDGRLRSSAPIDSRRGVAISVNGIVQAVTQSYPDRGAERFSALLPERAFAAGENTVEIFVVEEDSAGDPILVPAIDRSGPSYSLARSESGDLMGIDATNGTGCTLVDTAVTGGAFRDGLSFWGWALDATGRSPGVVIMAFVDGSLAWAGPTGTSPPAAIEPIEQPGFETSGFVFGLTRPLLPRGDDSDLRLFGVVGERCSELLVVDN